MALLRGANENPNFFQNYHRVKKDSNDLKNPGN